MDIFEEAVELSGCEFISDLKLLGEQVLDLLYEIDFEKYDSKEIKKFMCYLFNGQHNIEEVRTDESIYSTEL